MRAEAGAKAEDGDRGWKLRTGLVEVENEAAVAQRKAVRQRGWFRHRLGSSRVNASLQWTSKLPKQPFALSR